MLIWLIDRQCLDAYDLGDNLWKVDRLKDYNDGRNPSTLEEESINRDFYKFEKMKRTKRC